MSYPFGAQVPPVIPDLPYTIIQRRQGDVKATLIPIELNGQPVNISTLSFLFSVTLPSGVQTVTWNSTAPSNGLPLTTIAAPGFTIPSFNSTVSVPVVSSTGIDAGDQIQITVAGVYYVQSVTDINNIVALNTGLAGNISSGIIPVGANIFDIGQIGMSVLVIPSSITSSPVGAYPCYCKYTTSDPFPGPYTMTFLQGVLQILPQNDP